MIATSVVVEMNKSC